MKCGECKGYCANYCHTYDEITHPDSEVSCVGYEPTATCGECCYYANGWCEFYNASVNADGSACEAWEPVVEL